MYTEYSLFLIVCVILCTTIVDKPTRHFAIIIENAKKMIESLPIAQATPEFARRSNDDKHSLESRAREIAKQEGPTSLVASTLAIIDAYRRQGRVIEIVGLTSVSDGDDRCPMQGHKIHWREMPSVVADRQGYLDGHSGLVKSNRRLNPNHINRLGWLALGCGIVLGLAMGFGLGPLLGS
jgi:hypothetical protein